MNPWSFESKDFGNKHWKTLKYVSTPTIENFMNPHEPDKKLFLIGTKGCGKTLLLHKLAYEYFNGARKSEDMPSPRNLSDALVEVLAFANLDLTDATILELKDHNRWKDLWTFAIGIHTLRVSGEPIPKDLQKLVDELEHYRQVRFLVPHLLNNYEDFHFSRRIFRHNNLLMSCLSTIQDRYVLFLDGLDQALSRFLSSTSSRYDELLKNDSYLLFTVWKAAQFGLLLACTDVTKTHNRRLMIFATAREEALWAHDQISINVKGYCLKLEYTDDKLKEIFENNIQMMDAKQCFTGRWDILAHRMFGCEDLAHLVPKEENGNLKRETGFEMVLRHSFRRPREIVLLGSLLYEKINVNLRGEPNASEKMKIDIRMEVHKQSNKAVLAEYKKEIFPRFKEKILTKFMKRAKSNVISRQELDDFPEDWVDYLYQIGLLGYVNGNTQHFERTISLINPERNRIPYSDYYLVHPSLDLRFQEKYSNEEFYYKHSIIGHGLEFTPPTVKLTDFTEGKTVGYFMPDGLPGKSENKWKSVKINVENPSELYEQVFMKMESNRHQSRRDRVISAERLLTQLLFWWGMETLEKDHQSTKPGHRANVETTIANLAVPSEYNAPVEGFDNKALDLFSYRLFGRIVLAGMVLALGYDNSKAKMILKHFNPVGDSTLSTIDMDSTYLRQAFFIAKLPGNGSLNAAQIRDLWENLSPFERDFLSTWFQKVVLNGLSREEIFSPEEQRYLQDKLKKNPFYQLSKEHKAKE